MCYLFEDVNVLKRIHRVPEQFHESLVMILVTSVDIKLCSCPLGGFITVDIIQAMRNWYRFKIV